VATGRWSRDELGRYQPDFLIDDLSDVETIIDNARMVIRDDWRVK